MESGLECDAGFSRATTATWREKSRGNCCFFACTYSFFVILDVMWRAKGSVWRTEQSSGASTVPKFGHPAAGSSRRGCAELGPFPATERKRESHPVLPKEANAMYKQSHSLHQCFHGKYLFYFSIVPGEGGAEMLQERVCGRKGGTPKTLDGVQYAGNKTLRSRHHYKIIDCGEQSHIPRWSIGHLTYQ